MTIGEKIKSLRKSKGMTQSELCTGQITRNMLSLIENDLATPSLQTLSFLAERLGISAGYFLDSDDTLFSYRKLALVPEIRRLFAKGAKEECLALCLSLENTDDEISFIFAEIYSSLAKESFEKGLLASCEAFLATALEYSKKTVYRTKEFENFALSLRADIEAVKEGRLPDFPPKENASSELVEYHLYLYMLHITKSARYDVASAVYDTMRFSNTLYKKHINARLSALARNHSRAVTLLGELIDSFELEKPSMPFRLQVYIDMENSCKLIGDYEKAYTCLVKKDSLLQNFNK